MGQQAPVQTIAAPQDMQQAPVQTIAAPQMMVQQAPVQTMVAPQSLAPKQATVLSGGIGGMGSQMMTSPQYMQQAPVQTIAAPQYMQQATVQSFAAPQMMVQQAPLQTMAAPQYIQQAQTLAPTSMMRGASFGRTNMIRG